MNAHPAVWHPIWCRCSQNDDQPMCEPESLHRGWPHVFIDDDAVEVGVHLQVSLDDEGRHHAGVVLRLDAIEHVATAESLLSPAQARALAQVLVQHADKIEQWDDWRDFAAKTPAC